MIMAVAAPLGAAELHEPHAGTSCGPGFEGTWHFVNNQTEGADTGSITVITDAGVTVQVADKTNRNVQHWWVVGGSTLIDASTDLPGRLVLSDYSCREVKKSSD
jgi:hypothetical protein